MDRSSAALWPDLAQCDRAILRVTAAGHAVIWPVCLWPPHVSYAKSSGTLVIER